MNFEETELNSSDRTVLFSFTECISVIIYQVIIRYVFAQKNPFNIVRLIVFPQAILPSQPFNGLSCPFLEFGQPFNGLSYPFWTLVNRLTF